MLDVLVFRDDLPGLPQDPGRGVRQLQQAAAEQDLPQGHAGGLLQLHAADLLEQRLSARLPQLPDL